MAFAGGKTLFRLQFIANIVTQDRVTAYLKMGMLALVCLYAYITTQFVIQAMDTGNWFIGRDFIAFFTGVELWQQGQSVNLYDFEAQQQFQFDLTKHYNPGLDIKPESFGYSAFINPPISILLYWPFSQYGYYPGLILWLSFGGCCLLLGIHLLQRANGGLQVFSTQQLLVCALVFFPTHLWFGYGQATALIFCIWCACYYCLGQQRDLLAGLVLSLLIFKPQLALPLALPIILNRRYRVMVGGIIGVVGWLVISEYLFPGELSAYLSASGELLEWFRRDDYKIWQVHSVYGFANLLFYRMSPVTANITTAVLSLVLLGCIARLWWKAEWQPGSADWNIRLALTAPLGMLLAMQLFSYDLMLLLFPFYLIIGQMEFWTQQKDKLLDNGPVLTWTTLVYIACILSSFGAEAMLKYTDSLSLGNFGVQFSTLCILGWCYALWRHYRRFNRVPSAH